MDCRPSAGMSRAWVPNPRRYTGGGKMSKRNVRGMFAQVFCVGVRSGIIVALYLAAFLGALVLPAVLPEPWSAVGITSLVLVAGLAFRGKWPGGGFRLGSGGLGYE